MSSLDAKQVLFFTIVLFITWILSLAVQRLFLSPLSKIPGPRLAALTYWYECYYDVFQPGRYPWKLKELHDQYGPIIRSNPTVVHISDLNFLDTIYSSKERNDPSPNGLLVEKSVGGAQNYRLHKMRREALNPYFSQRTVLGLEPLLRQKTDFLRGRLDQASRNGCVLNMSDAYFAFTNDVVRRYSFGHDNDLLHDLETASIQRNNLAELLRGVHLNRHFGWVLAALGMISTLVGKKFVPPGLVDLLQFKSRIRQQVEEVLHNKIGAEDKPASSIFSELRDNRTLPEAERSADRLTDEATLLVMAGTESPAKTLSIAQYYLLANPKMLQRLRAELSVIPTEASITTLLSLPYLSAVLTEANRLSFGVTGRLLRTAPHEALHYKDFLLPPNTALCCTTFCAHTDETVFPDPWTFNPDRWLGSDGRERQKYMMSFGKGHRKCVGINLANAELCLAIATAAQYEMELFETDESDVKFQHDYQISHPRLDSKGVKVLVKGRAW